MAKAVAFIQDIGQKMSGKEHLESRILQVDMPTPVPVDIQFTNITMTVSEGFRGRNKKIILKGVSGLFKSGHLTAIMGPSGAGKSTLLNALTGFSTSGVTGKIRAGDSVCELSTKSKSMNSLRAYRKKSCYILQDDRLNPLFTVSELMKFAADMKLGNTLTEKLKLSVINEILVTIGLKGTENTRCVNLSGGQRKRLCIAVELIDNPPVVFLDEPTTGLDSMTSMQCMSMLKNLAKKGRTIVCTIHQPPASLYAMFDQVYILAEGMCIYNGQSSQTVSYLATLGLNCPKYHNPADYILEIANCEYGKLNDVLAENCKNTQLNDYEDSRLQLPSTDSQNNEVYSCGKVSVIVNNPTELYKFGILLKRSFIHQIRDWTTTYLKAILHVLIGILMGLLYEKAGSDASKTFNNLGFLIVSCAYLYYTSVMPAVLKFPLELTVLKKENFNNWYKLSTYYAASIATSIPLQIFYSFVYSVPSYFLSGQPMEIGRFSMFVLTLACVTLIADAVGNVIGTCVNPVNGTFFAAIQTCSVVLFAGFLVLFTHMSEMMKIVSYLSSLKYAYEALVLSIYSYGRQPLDCPETIFYCHLRHPSLVISEFSMTYNNYWTDITVLIIEIIIIRYIAYLTLKRSVKRSQ